MYCYWGCWSSRIFSNEKTAGKVSAEEEENIDVDEEECITYYDDVTEEDDGGDEAVE